MSVTVKKALPEANSDFYAVGATISEEDQALLRRTRDFLEAEVAPVIDEHASLAKAYCTVKMRESVGYARELLGGNGILLDHQVGRFVADAEAIYSYEGTREMNTLIVGRAITGFSAFV
jgi:glutaryl-CoA dehydrogenase